MQAGSSVQDDEVPSFIQKMDDYLNQQDDSSEGLPELDPKIEEELFKEFPMLRTLHERTSVRLHNGKTLNCDDDSRVFSKLYLLLKPRYPNPYLLAGISLFLYFAIRASIRTVRARYSILQIVTCIVTVESFLVCILAVAIPLVLTLYVVATQRDKPAADCITRMLVMYCLSAVMLAPVAGTASTGNITLALNCGIVVRSAMLAPTLWYWKDLCKEQMLGTSILSRIFQSWRMLVTITVLIPGIIIRVLGLANTLPFNISLYTSADTLRRRMGSRFPVACSLFNDPRGLYFLSGLFFIAAGSYLIYLVVFALDFLRVRNHRSSKTILSQLLKSRGVFQPDIHPMEIEGKLSAQNLSGAYIPSPAMLLKPKDRLLDPDSRFLSTETSLPIFALLDNEEEILRSEGAKEWIKSRERQLPITEDYSETQRALDSLYNWARPLEGSEAEQSFEEFFDTIDDSQYQYDHDSGEWILKNQELFREPPSYESPIISEDDMKEDQRINDNLTQFATSSEMQPFLKKYIEDFDSGIRDDEDDDEDNTPIYV